MSVTVEIALMNPNGARLEFTGPMGIRAGLLQINSDWIQFFVPRENLVIRFPANEFLKDTRRRDNFLALLPFPLAPEVFFDTLLTRTEIGGYKSCLWDTNEGAFVYDVWGADGSSRWVWVEPTDEGAIPHKVFYFDRRPDYPLLAETARPSLQVQYSEPEGLGANRFPMRMEVFKAKKNLLHLHWNFSELWEAPSSEVFQWRPSASMVLKDY